jgi:hypothetical protein
MTLPELNKPNTKIPISGQHQQQPRNTAIKNETFFTIPSPKGKFLNQPNRTVAESSVSSQVKGRQEEKTR